MSKSLQFLNKCIIVRTLCVRKEVRKNKVKTFFGGIFIETNRLKEEGIEYPIKVEYYKLEDENKIYGIEIIKKEYRLIGTKVEREEIKSLSKDECKIERMLELFKKNEVTPITAGEIAEDFFGKPLAKSVKLG